MVLPSETVIRPKFLPGDMNSSSKWKVFTVFDPTPEWKRSKSWKKDELEARASSLRETEVDQNLTAWLDTTPDALTWFFVYEEPAGLKRFLGFLEFVYGREAIHHDRALPGSAEPVLKILSDGTVIRLWSPPGPNLKKDRTSLFNDELTLLERVYEIEDE